jgi:DUF1680 family protein
MYCAGHMMEAAVAYFQATGKRRLLDVMLRMARHIDSVIGPEEGKMHAFPGHQEIELALVKMYGVTGERFLLKLADYFLRQRGTEPNYFVEERAGREETAFKGLDRRYWQTNKHILEQEALVGTRCVRCTWPRAWRWWHVKPRRSDDRRVRQAL